MNYEMSNVKGRPQSLFSILFIHLFPTFSFQSFTLAFRFNDSRGSGFKACVVGKPFYPVRVEICERGFETHTYD